MQIRRGAAAVIGKTPDKCHCGQPWEGVRESHEPLAGRPACRISFAAPAPGARSARLISRNVRGTVRRQ